MTDQLKGLLITTAGALLIVPDSLFVRLIDADALTIAFWRAILVGGLITLGVLVLQGARPFRALMGTGIYGLLYVLIMGVSTNLFIIAVDLTSVANVVFIIASMPVFAAIYSRIFLGEPISRRMVVTMAAVFVGLGIIAYGSGSNENTSYLGDFVALLVAALFAAALTVARKVRDVSMVPGVGLAYLLSAAVLVVLTDPLAVAPDKWHFVPMHSGIIVLSAVCLALGPRYITSAEVALLILLESVLAPLLVWA
ncbi:MAG: EamA family transporter, partial [Lutimaribacter sp.]